MKKSFWVILLILVMVAGVLSGCTKAETGMQDLYQEMTNMERYEGSGEFSFSINSLPSEVADEAESVLIKNNINKYAITYEGKIDMVSKQMVYNFFLKDKSTGVSQELTTMLLTGDTIYFKVSGIVTFLKMFNDAGLNQDLEQAFGGKEYLAIPVKQLASEMAASPTMGPQPFAPTGDFLGDSQEQSKLIMKIFRGLSKEVLNNYQSDLATQSGNKYTLSVTPASGAEWFISLVTYTVKNAEKLGSFMVKSLTDFSDAEMTTLGMDPAMRQVYISQVQEGINQLVASREETLAQIGAMSGPTKDEFIKMFDGSEYTIVMEKTATQSYKSSTAVKILYQDPQDPAGKLDIGMTAANTVKACDAFTVSAPASGVITLDELEKRMTQTMNVQTGSGAYQLSQGDKLSQGKIGVKIIDGSSYLQLRPVAEALDEEVNWDPTIRSAYVERSGGSRINLRGNIINGSTFIKIRDFEKLDYQIQWDAKTKTVTIIKKSFF